MIGSDPYPRFNIPDANGVVSPLPERHPLDMYFYEEQESQAESEIPEEGKNMVNY